MKHWEDESNFDYRCADAMSSAHEQLKRWELEMECKGDAATEEDYNIEYIYDNYTNDIEQILAECIGFLLEGEEVEEETEFALVEYHVDEGVRDTVLTVVFANDIHDEDVEEVVLTFKAKETDVDDDSLIKIADAVAKWENRGNEEWISNWWDLMHYKDMY